MLRRPDNLNVVPMAEDGEYATSVSSYMYSLMDTSRICDTTGEDIMSMSGQNIYCYVYHISSNKRPGVYLFKLQACPGVYSRQAFIWGRHLFISFWKTVIRLFAGNFIMPIHIIFTTFLPTRIPRKVLVTLGRPIYLSKGSNRLRSSTQFHVRSTIVCSESWTVVITDRRILSVPVQNFKKREELCVHLLILVINDGSHDSDACIYDTI